jgi:hypothetical protein
MDALRNWAKGYADVGETHQVRDDATTRDVSRDGATTRVG